MRTGGNTFYLLNDHLTSTAITTNSSGARLNTNTELRYFPYGAARYDTANQQTIYRYTGQRIETGTGLYDYGARWYDPLIGRFLSADSIVPNPGDSQALNRYMYVLGNPLRYIDPTGHTTICGAACEAAYNWTPPRPGGSSPRPTPRPQPAPTPPRPAPTGTPHPGIVGGSGSASSAGGGAPIRSQVEALLDLLVERAKSQVRSMMKPPPFNLLSMIGVPVPNVTLIADIGGLAGAGVAGRTGMTLAFGDGDAMLLVRAGGGGVAPWIASSGFSLGLANSPVVELPGSSVQAGAMVEFPQVLSITGEMGAFRGNQNGQVYSSVAIGAAANLPDGVPVAVWGTAETSVPVVYVSTDQWIDRAYSWWMAAIFGGK